MLGNTYSKNLKQEHNYKENANTKILKIKIFFLELWTDVSECWKLVQTFMS